MPRGPFACFAIVAAFFLHLAAATPVVEDVPLAREVVEFAVRLGLDPARDPSHFVTDVSRLLYGNHATKPPVFGPPDPATPSNTMPSATVPVPLPSRVWSRAVFRRGIAPDGLL